MDKITKKFKCVIKIKRKITNAIPHIKPIKLEIDAN